MTANGLMTADELERLPDSDKPTELVRGRMIVREPDISFVRHERMPDPILRGLVRVAPDLAIEVLSPTNRPGEVLEKVADYLNAGTLLVWVIDPDRRQARVHRADGTVSVISNSENLDGEDLLPGFSCALAQVL